MSENPYQSPSTIDLVSTTTNQTHRSFRLTIEPGRDEQSFQVGTIRQAILFTLIQQLPILFFAAMVLDGGSLFRMAVFACVLFWSWTFFLYLRDRGDSPDSEILVIKWGYLPLLLITYNAGLILAMFSR